MIFTSGFYSKPKCRRKVDVRGMNSNYNFKGINRVVLRKDKTLLFVVPNPEVFRKGDTWVVLGEARVEDPNQRAREMAAKKMAEQQAVKTPVKPVPTTISEEDEVNGLLNYFNSSRVILLFLKDIFIGQI